MPQLQKDRNPSPRAPTSATLPWSSGASLLALLGPLLTGCVDLLGDYRSPGCDPADCSPAPWVHGYGDAQIQGLSGLAVDPFGNILATGQFAGTVDFGAGALQSGGETDVYLIKLDPTGKTLWSKRFGNAGRDLGSSVAVDPEGNFLVAGQFSGTVDFGGVPHQSAGGMDIFVAKMSPAGDFIWSKQFGDLDEQIVNSVTADASGNILLTGCFRGSISFGGTKSGSLGDYDAYVAALDRDGNYRWDRIAGGPGFDCGTHVAADANGDAIVAGNNNAFISFGDGALPYGGGYDLYVAKLAAATGKPLWAHGFGDLNNQFGAGVSVAPSGTIAVTGSYMGTVNFQDHTLSAQGQDAFVLFLDPAGSTLRSVGLAADGNQQAYSSVLDSNGAVLLAGFSSTIPGQNQVAVAKVALDGSLGWSKTWSGIYNQFASSVAVDPADNVIIGGDFTGTLPIGGATEKADGAPSNAFIAKLGPDSRSP